MQLPAGYKNSALLIFTSDRPYHDGGHLSPAPGHAGVLHEHLQYVKKRLIGIVSRGGSLLAKWMLVHNQQNPMYVLWEQICDVMREYDVSFSIGDGLRPGGLADATDEAQLAELKLLLDRADTIGALRILKMLVPEFRCSIEHRDDGAGEARRLKLVAKDLVRGG